MTEQAFACDMHRETVPGGLLSATVVPRQRQWHRFEVVN